MQIPNNDWSEILAKEVRRPYYSKLESFLEGEYASKTIYPPRHEVFDALRHTSYEQTRVVILGQDPYIRRGQAHGLAFSVKEGKVPPSLRNIFKELHDDTGAPIPEHGCLEGWAKQGVLLLNTILTVEEGSSGSHAGLGWEVFTDHILEVLSHKRVVFLLWGKHAQAKAHKIKNQHNLVLEAAHPSPLARGKFFGSKPFSKTNAYLGENNLGTISW